MLILPFTPLDIPRLDVLIHIDTDFGPIRSTAFELEPQIKPVTLDRGNGALITAGLRLVNYYLLTVILTVYHIDLTPDGLEVVRLQEPFGSIPIISYQCFKIDPVQTGAVSLVDILVVPWPCHSDTAHHETGLLLYHLQLLFLIEPEEVAGYLAPHGEKFLGVGLGDVEYYRYRLVLLFRHGAGSPHRSKLELLQVDDAHGAHVLTRLDAEGSVLGLRGRLVKMQLNHSFSRSLIIRHVRHTRSKTVI